MKPILLLGGVTEALAIARTLGPNISTVWPVWAACRPTSPARCVSVATAG